MVASPYSFGYVFVHLFQCHRGHGQFWQKVGQTLFEPQHTQNRNEIVERDIPVQPLFEMTDGGQAHPGLFRHLPLADTGGKAVLLQAHAKESNDVLIGGK